MEKDIASIAPTSNTKLSYKYQRLRERLRQAVQDGEWSGKLPGERRLAKCYRANAKTINKALNDLALEGLLVRHIGRGTFVAGSEPSEKTLPNKLRHFGWLTPAGQNHSYRYRMYDRAVEMLQQKGHRLTRLYVMTSIEGELMEDTLGPGALHEMDGVVLFSSHPSREFLATLRRRHVPMVMANNHHKQIKTPVVVSDYSHGAFSLCEQLVALGHSRIQLLISSELLPAATAAETGYHAVMNRHGLRTWKPLTVAPGLDWQDLLAGDDRPTALVCVGGPLAVEASDQAVVAGLVQPSMLSISALAEPGETLMAERSITAYEVDPELIVYWITELLVSAPFSLSSEMVVVPGCLRDRGSAAPPMSGPSPGSHAPDSAVI